jgi:hypothetical protein
MIFFFVKAIGSEVSKKYFILSGLFGFLGLFQRFEIIFISAPLCIAAYLSRKPGRYYFILITLFFQVFWLIFSQLIYGSALRSYQVVSDYIAPLSIQGISLGVRLQGFFLPYYFIFLGVTLFLFWFMIKGFLFSWKTFPKIITITVLISILTPALLNGTMSLKSTLYYMTHYMYFAFYFPAVFAAIGLVNTARKFTWPVLRVSFITAIILTCIPLSYVKEFAPVKLNKLFPKVLQFIATSEDPKDAWKMIDFIDNNIKQYPALIFDTQNSASSVFYIPYRTKLPGIPADNPRLFITGYNVPATKEELKKALIEFIANNRTGILIVKRTGTVMGEVFHDFFYSSPADGLQFTKIDEAGKWDIYTYK